MVKLAMLLDDAKCYATVRELRWKDGVTCPRCSSQDVTKQGRDEVQHDRQRYGCKACGTKFDDLTGTIFAGHHQPLSVWMACLYLMGLNLSNRQIALELGLNKDDAQQMTKQLRKGVVRAQPQVTLSGVVEADEVYITAGHKGQPGEVQKRGARQDKDG